MTNVFNPDKITLGPKPNRAYPWTGVFVDDARVFAKYKCADGHIAETDLARGDFDQLQTRLPCFVHECKEVSTIYEFVIEYIPPSRKEWDNGQ